MFWTLFLEVLPAEHGTTELHSQSPSELEDQVGDVAYHDQRDLCGDLCELCHDVLSIGFHYMTCIFCDLYPI